MKYILTIITILTLFSCQQKQVEITHPDGRKEIYGITKDSLKHGDYIAYDEKGQVTEKAQYKNGQLDGQRQVIFNNVVLVDEQYKNGVLSGKYVEYHENGNPAFEIVFQNGKMEGIGKTYYPSGKLKGEALFVNNEENGPFKEYHENGKIAWEGTFRKGDNEYGELKKYDKEGRHIRTSNCDERAICTTIWTLEN